MRRKVLLVIGVLFTTFLGLVSFIDHITPVYSASVITIRYPQDGQWPSYKDSNYVMEINPWNISSATGTVTLSYEPQTATFTLDYDLSNIRLRNPSAYVHSYPEIFVGNKPWNSEMVRTNLLPKSFSTIQDFDYKVTATYNLENLNNIPLNLAFETWLTKDKFRTNGIRGDEVEIMIWFYSNKLNPAGSKIAEVVLPVVVNGNLEFMTFEVYKGYIGWHYIAFRSKQRFTSASLEFYLNDFLELVPQYLNKNLDTLYIESLELGTESGSPNTQSVRYRWQISGFNLTITPKGADITPTITPTVTPTITPTPTPVITVTSTPTPTPTPIPVTSDFLPNQLRKTSEWGKGFCAKVTVYNNTSRSVRWKTRVNKDAAYTIYTLWSANKIAVDSQSIVFEGKYYNRILAPNESTEFGFCARYEPVSAQTLTYVPANVQITSDWGRGYCANVTVRNTTGRGIFWVTNIDRVNLKSLWSAQCTEDGNKLRCVGVDWNKYLEAGEQTSFGFCARR